jgi:hypothetical protein
MPERWNGEKWTSYPKNMERDTLNKANAFVIKKETKHLEKLMAHSQDLEEELYKTEKTGTIDDILTAQSRLKQSGLALEKELLRQNSDRAFDEEEWMIGNIEVNKRKKKK